MAAKRAAEVEEDEIDELEDDDDSIDPSGEAEEEEEDEKPRKVVAKTKPKRVVEEEEEEEKPAKKKVAKASKDEEEDEKPAKKKVLKMKSGKAKAPKVQKHRWERHGWKTPFEPDGMVGKAFQFILDGGAEGVKLSMVKKLIEKNRQSDNGGSWVLSDIRKGRWNGGTWECWEKDGRIGVRKLRLIASEAA